MPLRHLLYRCPLCGHDPTRGDGDEASCPGCGATFHRTRPGASIRLQAPGEEPREARPRELVRRIQDLGGVRPAATATSGDSGEIRYEAVAFLSETLAHQAVRHGGELLGFFETPGPELRGTLAAAREGLEFRPDGAGEAVSWPFLDITGLQVSSSALQIKPRGGPMVQLRFPQDSPLRWEELVKWLLAEAWQREGRGTVVEFQPRVAVA